VSARRSDMGDAVSAVRVCCIACCVVSIKITRLSLPREKHEKRSKQRAQYFIYEQKIGNLKSGNILPKRKGWHTFLAICSMHYAAVSQAVLRDVERLA